MTVEARREQQTFIDAGFGIVINKHEVAYTMPYGTSSGGIICMKSGEKVGLPTDEAFKNVTVELLTTDGTFVSYRT